MRVICFDEGFRNEEDGYGDYIEELNTYTVLYCGAQYISHMQRWVEFYSLKELSGLYEQCLFLPLSNICEIELLKDRNNNP